MPYLLGHLPHLRLQGRNGPPVEGIIGLHHLSQHLNQILQAVCHCLCKHFAGLDEATS